MTRAENNTIVGSEAAARAAECAVCGKPLRFKDEKQDNTTIIQAKHCGKIYTIGAASPQAVITMAPDPKFVEKENKINEKRQKAAQLRRKGKSEEAAKLDDECDKEYEELAQEEGSDEPKTDAGGRRTASQEEEKRGYRK